MRRRTRRPLSCRVTARLKARRCCAAEAFVQPCYFAATIARADGRTLPRRECRPRRVVQVLPLRAFWSYHLAQRRSASISYRSVSNGNMISGETVAPVAPLAQGNQNETLAPIDLFAIFATQHFLTLRDYTCSCASSADSCPADPKCDTRFAIEYDRVLLLQPG